MVAAPIAPTPTELPIAALLPSEDNPRRSLDPASLAGLVSSIQSNGIIQPLVVRAAGDDGRYEIIAGHRRHAAALLAGLTMVPVRILDLQDERQVHAARLVENLQRANLDPIEEASSIERMRVEYHMTDQAIGDLVGKSGTWVSRTRCLLELPRTVQDALRERRLSTTQGWALQRYRAFPALVERLAVIAQRDGIAGKALDAPFVQPAELAGIGLIVWLGQAPFGFDRDQCEVCPFHAFFPAKEGGYCAKPSHYRVLVHEARAREHDGRSLPKRTAPAKPVRKAVVQVTPLRLRQEIAQRLRVLDRLIERLSAGDADDELRVLVQQHVAVLERVIGSTTVVEALDEEVPA